MKDFTSHIVTPAVVSTIVSAVILLFFKDYLGETIRQSIRSEYEQRLELYKSELEVRFADQVKQRKMYEELAMSLEEIFTPTKSLDQREMSQRMNKTFALLAIYAPDSVYLECKNAIPSDSVLYGKDVSPRVYAAIRRAIFGSETKLQASDLLIPRSFESVPPKK